MTSVETAIVTTALPAIGASLIGLALFAVGSLMSGLSVSMPGLITFRGLMGLGGAAPS